MGATQAFCPNCIAGLAQFKACQSPKMLLYETHLLLEMLRQRCCPLLSVAEGRSSNMNKLLLDPCMCRIDLIDKNSNRRLKHLSGDAKGYVIAALAVVRTSASTRLLASASAVPNLLCQHANKGVAKAKGESYSVGGI